MGQKQVSRIQVRRGPLVDLSGVTLNTGEFGWAIDEKRLFVGNRLEEGAPSDDNIEILTELSGISYQYIDDVTDARSILDRARDRVSLFDFGFDKTASATSKMEKFQEAADLLYNPSNNTQTPTPNATLFIPAFIYDVEAANYNTGGTTSSNGIRLYPGMHLKGENRDNTIIRSSATNFHMIRATNSSGEVSTDFTTASSQIVVENMTFEFTAFTNFNHVLLQNTSDVIFRNCKFVAEGTMTSSLDIQRQTITSDLSNIKFIDCIFDNIANVTTLSDANTISGIHFHNCSFRNLTTGIIAQNGIEKLIVSNCYFDTVTNACIDISTTSAAGYHISQNNHFKDSGTGITFDGSSFNNASYMDTFDNCTTNVSFNDSYRNMVIGPQETKSLGNGAPQSVSMSTTGADTTFLTIDSTVATVVELNYSLTQNSIERKGKLTVISDGTNISYNDEFIDVNGTTTLELKAIMNGTDIEIQYNATTNTATFKYIINSWLN